MQAPAALRQLAELSSLPQQPLERGSDIQDTARRAITQRQLVGVTAPFLGRSLEGGNIVDDYHRPPTYQQRITWLYSIIYIKWPILPPPQSVQRQDSREASPLHFSRALSSRSKTDSPKLSD